MNKPDKVNFEIGSVVRVKDELLENSESQGRLLIVVKMNYESQSFQSICSRDAWNAEAFDVIYD